LKVNQDIGLAWGKVSSGPLRRCIVGSLDEGYNEASDSLDELGGVTSAANQPKSPP
jgi:hypothetical protein